MNLSLGKRWEDFMEAAVADGRYKSSSELVREGLRLVEEREAKLRALQTHLATAIEEGGDHSEGDITTHLECDEAKLKAEIKAKAS